ncbi:hypothetical protein H5410_005939 [Solanum commersonii]|uniref:Uncharacterized protein n=1 Tax=Solanum commersonii TaxID=4109 RepID=A0A9J6A894_SOLCO|nr:hypothetical protein H5410_005939 [Solanum commersonii]
MFSRTTTESGGFGRKNGELKGLHEFEREKKKEERDQQKAWGLGLCQRSSVEKINIDVDKLHIILFHKIALELGVENVETFGCKVNKKGTFYMLNTDSDVLNLLNGLKGADSVDVYVVHPISITLVVEEILVLPSTNVDVSSSPQ